MTKRILTVCLLASVVMVGCVNKSAEKNSEAKQLAAEKLITTGIDLAPKLSEVDSIVILFYNDPFGGDAERYTRFYRQFGAGRNDTVLALLKQNLSLPFQKEDTLRKCRSEGKIFCFANSQPVQTVYFTSQSQACHHLYFIHEGRYYYFQPNPQFEASLRRVKLLAK